MVNFDRSKKFTKINIAKVSNDKAVVYKIKNISGGDIYVGVAGRGRVQDRLLEHKSIAKEKIPGGVKFQTVQVKNKTVALKLEERIIKKEQPKYNIQHKKGCDN